MLTPTFQLTSTALFSLIVTGNVLAQSTTERVFHFAHTRIEQGTREIATAIRVIAGAQDVSADFSAGTLSVHGTADQLELAEWLFLGMDRSVPVSLDSAVHEYRLRDGLDNVVRLFYLNRGQTVKDFQEFATLVRTIAEIRRIYPISETKILAIRGTADQISMADYFTNELEKSAAAPHPHSVTPEYLLPAVPSPRPNENATRILFVANTPTIQDFQDLATLIRNIAQIRRVFTYNSPKAIAIRGSSDQLAFAEWLFDEVDQPRNAESSHASAPYNYPDSTSTDNAVRVFYLHHTATVQDFQKIAVTIRTATGVRRLFAYNSTRALVLRGTLDQIEEAQRLLTQLDPADFPMAP